MKRIHLLLMVVLFLVGSAYSGCTQKEKIKVACVGNSITYGFGIENRDSLSYPAQLQKMMGSEYVVHNYGVSGRTMLKEGDHPYWDENAYDSVLKWNPDIVVIMLGTNDTKPWNWKYGEDFASDYKDFIGSFKNMPGQEDIWVAFPVPVFKQNKYQIRDSIIAVEIPIIHKVAQMEDVHVMNLNKALQPYGKYFFDGVHPDSTGAYYLAKAVYKNLMDAKKK